MPHHSTCVYMKLKYKNTGGCQTSYVWCSYQPQSSTLQRSLASLSPPFFLHVHDSPLASSPDLEQYTGTPQQALWQSWVYYYVAANVTQKDHIYMYTYFHILGNTFPYYTIGLAGLFIGLGEIIGKTSHDTSNGTMQYYHIFCFMYRWWNVWYSRALH